MQAVSNGFVDEPIIIRVRTVLSWLLGWKIKPYGATVDSVRIDHTYHIIMKKRHPKKRKYDIIEKLSAGAVESYRGTVVF